MKRKELILRLSACRYHLRTMMGWFEMFEDWENYLKCAVIFHEYDKLLKKELKERNT